MTDKDKRIRELLEEVADLETSNENLKQQSEDDRHLAETLEHELERVTVDNLDYESEISYLEERVYHLERENEDLMEEIDSIKNGGDQILAYIKRYHGDGATIKYDSVLDKWEVDGQHIPSSYGSRFWAE